MCAVVWKLLSHYSLAKNKMKSQYFEKFNHDDDAAGYDIDVKNENDPIRSGYSGLLNWVANNSNNRAPKRIIELGCGTGNLTDKLLGYNELFAVDSSRKMIEIARTKLKYQKKIKFVQMDLLESFDSLPTVNAILSTYTLHHLTEPEKIVFINLLWNKLTPGGFTVIGDLMFEDKHAKEKILNDFKNQNRIGLVEDINDEFFWNILSAKEILQNIGFSINMERFSELSWGLLLIKNN